MRATALIALAALGCTRATEIEPLGRPPVVLILFDALHAGHVSHLGYERETTPHLDRLAAEGVSFAYAFAPAPYTLASIPSLLTGRRPDSHGVTTPAARLAAEETTLAELLADAGYRTVGAVGNPNGSARFGNDQGFARFDELFRIFADGRDYERASADRFVAFARDELARARDGAPLFLYLHVLEPHLPYAMPDEYRALWLDPAYDGPFATGEAQPFLDTVMGKLDADERDVEAAIALYDANLRWADHNLGELRRLLEEAGLWDEALVVVTSDHGEAFWQHGRWGHMDQLFDEQLRVPLVIKLPTGRGLRGVVRDDLVSLLDVAPSVCQWLDLAPGALPLDGLPLAALVEDAAARAPERDLFLRSHHQVAHLALRTDEHKTIVERAQGAAAGGRTTRVQHYDLARDPAEASDVYERERARADAAARRLEAWSQEAAVNRNQRGGTLTAEELKMLEKLGYVDGDTDPGGQ
jgi:arylsulfatase